MTDEVRALMARNLPGYEIRSVTWLGEGLENAAYEVNSELIVRKSKEADLVLRSEATRREAALLATVAGLSSLPVPEPIFADIEAGVVAYFKLPGLPLMDRPVSEPARLAPALGEILGRLHRAPLQEVEDLVERDTYPMTGWQEDAERDYREIAEHLPATACRQVEEFLDRSPPEEPGALAFCHNDLGAEHVLVDAGTSTITGMIDWTDAAITDPARDLAMVYRDLGPALFDLTLAHYECRFDGADRERAVFYARCRLIEDIAYGLKTPGARRYTESNLSNLARTFA